MGSGIQSWLVIASVSKGFPGGSDGKASAHNEEDPSSILGWKEMFTHSNTLAWKIPWPGRSSGEGNGNPLQDSYLENSMDGGAWDGGAYSPWDL